MNQSTTSFWVCGRCCAYNLAGVGICRNPQCGGEPVSRVVDAVAQPSSNGSPVIDPARQCKTSGGVAKLAYASFDEANEAVLSIAQHQRKRVHAYRCLEHGWHVGSNKDAA